MKFSSEPRGEHITRLCTVHNGGKVGDVTPPPGAM